MKSIGENGISWCQIWCKKNRCYAHVPGASGDIVPFTEKRWRTFLSAVDIWSDLVGNQADLARSFVRDHGLHCSACESALPVPETGGCHAVCYRYFTDSTKQKRAQTAKQKHQNVTQSSGKFKSSLQIHHE